jgi:hypothetical protein
MGVKVRTHHADPDQVSVADADGKGAGMTVATLKVESSFRYPHERSVATGQRVQAELVAIVRALRGLDSHALRAFGAVISFPKTATRNGP